MLDILYFIIFHLQQPNSEIPSENSKECEEGPALRMDFVSILPISRSLVETGASVEVTALVNYTKYLFFLFYSKSGTIMTWGFSRVLRDGNP